MSGSIDKFEMLARYTEALSVALGYRDIYTKLHSDRVRDLSCQLGEACGLSADELRILRIAASFHDIGKIGIPDRILSKTDPLADAERVVIQRHSNIGEEILTTIGLPGSAEAAIVVRHHHEWFNGNGYPDGLVDDHIPIASRLIGIADSYDAMAERRSYHAPLGHRDILAVLEQERGTKHDPDLLDVFMRVVERSSAKAGEN